MYFLVVSITERLLGPILGSIYPSGVAVSFTTENWLALQRSAGERYQILLLVEETPAPPRDMVQRVVHHTLAELSAIDGPLDSELREFASDRPSKVLYQRIAISRSNVQLISQIGVVWLPQVRLIRKGKVLLRSAVQMGDNGHFITSDIGGMSFRRVTGRQRYLNLLDSIEALISR